MLRIISYTAEERRGAWVGGTSRMITRSSGVRSVAAAAFAAVAVFVLIGNDQPADGGPAPVPASVLASGGGSDESPPDREAVLEAVRGLLSALDLKPEDLLENGEDN